MHLKYCLVLFALFFALPASLIAQAQNIDFFEILPDAHYSLEQVRTTQGKGFVPYKKDMPFEADYYWVRFVGKNGSPYAQNVCVYTFPIFRNALFYYNYEKKAWAKVEAGMEIYTGHKRNNVHSFILQGGRQDTLYVKIKTAMLRKSPYLAAISLSMQSEKLYTEREQFLFLIWIATLTVMCAFFLYNLYIYFIFRDLTYLYYLLIVGSGMVYITALNHFFNVFWQARYFQIEVRPEGIYSVDINSLMLHLSILGVMTGFVQFTRLYLQLAYYLPAWNKVLLRGLWALWGMFLVSDVLTFSGVYYIDRLSSVFQNILILLLITGLLLAGMRTYQKGYSPARYFLIANALPLLLMMLLAGYFSLYINSGVISIASNIALIVQTLAFAVALVARVSVIKEELKQKQTEAHALQNEKEHIIARNQFIELENEYILAEIISKQNEKEELQTKLESNQRELTSNALYMYQKNELLAELQKQIERLATDHSQPKEIIKEIKSTIQNNLYLDADWDRFKIHFEQVQPHFFKKLAEKCPDLTSYEVRLSAYLHLNMSTKEIAKLLNIAPESVYKAKTRLNKKLGKAGIETGV